MGKTTKRPSWWNKIPECLWGDVDGAEDLLHAKYLAQVQLDLIEEGQDGTEDYTPVQIAQIKRFINSK